MRVNRNGLSVALTVVLALWVFILIAVRARDLLLWRASYKSIHMRPVPNWQNLLDGRSPVLGVSSASFKIIEFSDYQCPFCASADSMLSRFVGNHPKEVVVFRYDMPLSQIHHFAFAAARAATCADYQGVREPYQALLFQNQRSFAVLDWTQLAKQSGVQDANAFDRCIRSDLAMTHIHSDVKKAESIGLTGTPSFVINGQVLTEAPNVDVLESLYQQSRVTSK